jgi:hypothetical protein
MSSTRFRVHAVFRTDTGNFNRFLTSIGLLLLAAALLVPYFYFRDTDVLRISESQLQRLTPTARAALVRRQRRSADLEEPVLILSAFLASGGIVALIFGGKRLRLAQRKEDEAIDRKARREDYEIEKLSAEEVQQRRDEQAREEVEEAQEGPVDPKRQGPAPQPLPAEERPPASRPRVAPAGLQYQQRRAEIERVEEKTRLALEGSEFDSFEYLSEVRILKDVAGRQSISLDGLFESAKPNQPDVVMELKVVRTEIKTLMSRVRIFSDELLALVTRYKAFTGEDALGWLVLVVTDSVEPDPASEVQIRERFDGMMAGFGRCTLIREHQLDALPVRFKEIFGD